MMIEPPGDLWRPGILEINDNILIAVEDAILPRLGGPVGHTGELELSAHVKFLSVKAVKKSRGGRAIKAAIVETEPYLFHFLGFVVPPLSRSKMEEGTKPTKMYAWATIVKKKHRAADRRIGGRRRNATPPEV